MFYMATGKAVRFDGVGIDYVQFFRWYSGEMVATIKPDINGAWMYEPFFDDIYGITYISEKCIPKVHGPYNFLGKYGVEIHGYLVYMLASVGSYDSIHDPTATDSSTWYDKFGVTADIGLFSYSYGKNPSKTTTNSVILNHNFFGLSMQYSCYIGNSNDDDGLLIFEALDKNNNVLAVIKFAKNGSLNMSAWYGKNINTLKIVPWAGGSSYAVQMGIIEFKEDGFYYTNTFTGTGTWTPTFTYNIDLSTCTRIRVTGGVTSTSARNVELSLLMLPVE